MKKALRLLSAFILSVPVMLSANAQDSVQDLCLNTVVIDPGHGGKDPGTVSPDKKTYEKNLTLAISKLLAERIKNEYPGMKVVLTRDKDVQVKLDERARKASEINANLFISIHVNAARKSLPTLNGFSAYILGQSTDKSKDTYAFNMEVVARENSVIYLEDDYGTKYKDDDSPEAQILMKFMYNAFREQSLLFAEQVNTEMEKGPFRKCSGVYQANFCVLRLASMPAVLLELGFMTNPEDLSVLRSEKALAEMADNVFSAFCKFKTEYDRSVSSEEIAIPNPEPQQKIPESQPQSCAGETFYGIQVLASTKKMASSDRYFKGYDNTAVQVGNLIKYIILPSGSEEQVRKAYSAVKKDFPDSFIVKVEGEKISIIK